MKYQVIIDFTDNDNGHIYRAGDVYPFKGKTKKDRVAELLSANNKRKQPLIKEVSEDDK